MVWFGLAILLTFGVLAIFAGLVSPHDPYDVTENCQPRNHYDSNVYEGYKASYRCVLKEILEFMSYINFEDPKAIVVFQADHGWIIPEKVKKVSESQVVSNLKNYTFDHVCLSCSFESTDLIRLKGLVKRRGQVTYIQDDGELKNLKVPICAEGYISPTSEGIKIVGSTYNNKNNENTTLEDNLENIKKLRLISDQEVKVVGSDSGYRATTRDHLPLVGKTKGIFINIGHGSRGLSSAPITGQFISDLISGSHPVFGKDVIKSLYPERFKGKV